eukprot:10739994-Prorocentrum_lima.AAC.1
MTSSLVGSEMCIRDSPTTPINATYLRLIMAIPGCRWDNHNFIMGHRLRTVSYTHLTLPTICSV